MQSEQGAAVHHCCRLHCLLSVCLFVDVGYVVGRRFAVGCCCCCCCCHYGRLSSLPFIKALNMRANPNACDSRGVGALTYATASADSGQPYFFLRIFAVLSLLFLLLLLLLQHELLVQRPRIISTVLCQLLLYGHGSFKPDFQT